LKAYQEGEWVVVQVADNGPGIPPAAQGKIFDPFFTTKPPGEGTGLGLNLAHGIVVEKHRGQISVDSRPGKTRFTVKLPITVD
jgi:signal transduction histidine kinase